MLDHYLEVLTRKPGALSGSTALLTARASKAFTPAHQQYWDAARKQLGDGPGTRAGIATPPAPVPVPAAAPPAAGTARPAPSLAGYDQLIGQVTA